MRKDADWLKVSVLDVLAVDEKGTEYDIEIQVPFEPNFRNRSLYYWAKLYSAQLEKGAFYETLNPVICINLLDFVLFRDLAQFHTCFMLTDKKIPDSVLTEDLQIHFIELPKAVQFRGRLAEIARLIREAAPETEMGDDMNILIKKDPVYQKMYDEYAHCLDDKSKWYAAFSREKFQRDQASRNHYYEQQGLQKGLEQGIEQGIKKGIAQGREQGIRAAKIEMAKKLQAAGMSAEQIARTTGLTAEELRAM